MKSVGAATLLLGLLLGLVGLASRPTTQQAVPLALSPGLGVLLIQVLASWAILVGGAVLVALAALWPARRRKRTAEGEQMYQPRHLHWALKLGLLLVQLLLVAGLVAWFAHWQQENPTTPLTPIRAAGQGGPSPLATRVLANFGTVFASVAVVTVLALAAAGGLWLWTQRQAGPPVQTAPPELARALDDGLAALERETDPRRAVILAYAAMERALARHDLPRQAPEAPVEYMLRVLAEMPAAREPVSRLTDLFEEAKFSHHVIVPASRAAAVDALSAIRETLGPAA